MIGDLLGGSTPDAAKKQLKQLGFDAGLREKSQTGRDDNGHRNDSMVMAVRFSDLGEAGTLELSFYNDRLMVAQFEPDEPGRYRKLLSARLGNLPEAAYETKQISKDVSLSYYGYYGETGAKTRFRWGYLPVLKEWQASLAKHSCVFKSQLYPNS
jgi:hypothetical protein